jgi:hypothetical protein
MANSHTVLMTAEEVRDRVLPILRRRLGKFGFVGDVKVAEEEDFDGAFVFRMTARVQDNVPARVVFDALGDIHLTLRKEGEDRFVYLSTQRPGEDDVDEADEDIE